jgi:hypothetical protein
VSQGAGPEFNPQYCKKKKKSSKKVASVLNTCRRFFPYHYSLNNIHSIYTVLVSICNPEQFKVLGRGLEVLLSDKALAWHV